MAVIYCAIVLAVMTALACSLLETKTRVAHFDVPPERANAIDGLRGLLAVCVMCHHFVLSTMVLHGGEWTAPARHELNNIGRMPVSLFFMISGFLFYGYVERRPDRTVWLAFFVKRFFRLAPMMWLATLVTGIAVVALHGLHGSAIANMVAIVRWLGFLNMPPLFGFDDSKLLIAGVAWSLSWEWAFYLVLPLLSLFAAHLGARRIVLGLAAALLASLMLIDATHAHVPAMVVKAIRFSTPLAAGLAIAVLVRHPKLAAILSHPATAVAAIALQAAALFIFAEPFGAFPFLIQMLLLAALCAGNGMFGLLSLPPVVALGETTYSLYLLHGLMLYAYFHTLAPAVSATFGDVVLWATLPLFAVAAVAAAFAAHKHIELPFTDLGKRLAPHLSLAIKRRLSARPASTPVR